MDLYRCCYADSEGLDALLTESGLGGGRPARRGLRTLDVCLGLEEGGFLATRDSEGAARVDGIDRSTWRFTVTGRDGTEILGAVRLADRYRAASPSEFRVMRQFAPDELMGRLKDDPASVVIELCMERGKSIDTDTLEAILVPDLLGEEDWKKWWTRARTALKRCPNIRIEGRSPYRITYVDKPVALEDELLAQFGNVRGPLKRFDLVEKYLRMCKERREQVSEAALARCAEQLTAHARRLTEAGSAEALLAWTIAHKVATAGGDDGIPDEAITLIKASTDLTRVFQPIEREALLELACVWLAEARPDDWAEQLLDLLPGFTLPGCEWATRRLVEAGVDAAGFEPVVQQIMASAVRHFEALLWLWDSPSQAERIPLPPSITLLSRILRTLEECRRSERIPKETTRRLAGRAKSVLSARKFERFDQCLEGLDAEMARALRNQIRRLDSLGQAVRSDLQSRLDRRFPLREAQARVEPWMRDDVLYVTREGLSLKQQEIDHHVNVKMRENAKAIGRAAEHGDLSENAEYKFALEERDLLRARLAQMNAEVAAAHVITPDEVPLEQVGIGTKAVFKRVGDGEPYELSFLGPWEADTEKGRLNYRAPLAHTVLGKRIGDTIEFDHTGAVGTYEIVALENALASEPPAQNAQSAAP
jgi:transcription elongation GreA/GreB family factor